MKHILAWFMKAFVAGICAIAILSAFCMVYAYDGIHIANETGATDYTWNPHQLKATMREGFSWIHMDAYGYNNVADYSKEPDILLMGSSHVEGAQVKTTENVGHLLNTLLPNYQTYNIGMSGHTIYRCIDNLENALNAYHPKQYVVMVVDSVDLSIDSMNEVVQGKATPIPSYDSGLIYYMQKIPAIKTIYKQLDDWVSLENAGVSTEKTEKTADEITTEDYIGAVSQFLDVAASAVQEHNVELIVVFKPAYKLGENGQIKFQYNEDNLRSFASLCEEKQIVFYDMTEVFADLFCEKQQFVYGFLNSEAGAGHLNKIGHRTLAEAICGVIEEKEGQ